MKWVLLIMLKTYDCGSYQCADNIVLQQVPMETRELCLAAGNQAIRSFKSNSVGVRALCVPSRH